MFEVYRKSPMICSELKGFSDEEVFSQEINNKLKLQFGQKNDLYNMLKIKDESEEDIKVNDLSRSDHKPQNTTQLSKFTGFHTLPSIAMVSIDLYTDGKYPRGLSVLYKIDGHKTRSFTYLERKFASGTRMQKHSIELGYNEYVTQLEMWKTDDQVLNCLAIHIGTKPHAN